MRRREGTRRVLAWILAAAMCMGNVPVSAFAEDATEVYTEQQLDMTEAYAKQQPDTTEAYAKQQPDTTEAYAEQQPDTTEAYAKQQPDTTEAYAEQQPEWTEDVSYQAADEEDYADEPNIVQSEAPAELPEMENDSAEETSVEDIALEDIPEEPVNPVTAENDVEEQDQRPEEPLKEGSPEETKEQETKGQETKEQEMELAPETEAPTERTVEEITESIIKEDTETAGEAVEEVRDEEDEEDQEDIEAEESSDAVEYPAFSVEEYKVQGTDITVSVYAPEGAFPAGIRMYAGRMETPEDVYREILQQVEGKQDAASDSAAEAKQEKTEKISHSEPLEIPPEGEEGAEELLPEEIAELEEVVNEPLRAYSVAEDVTEEPAQDVLTREDIVSLDIHFYLPEDPDTEIEPKLPVKVVFGNLDTRADALEVYHTADTADGNGNRTEKVKEAEGGAEEAVVENVTGFSEWDIVLFQAAGSGAVPDDYQLSVNVFSGAKKNNLQDVVWTANSSSAGHRFGYRISYTILSSETTLAPGEVRISIPKQLLKDNNGNYADAYELSVPSRAEVDADPAGVSQDADFAYMIEGDNIVIYNIEDIPAGTKMVGYIELGYATTKTTFNYPDYDPAGEHEIDESGAEKRTVEPFRAVMTIGSEESPRQRLESSRLYTYLDTSVTVQAADKRYPTMYKEWQTSAWGTAPEDAKDYWYLAYTIQTTIDPSSTQSYMIRFQDTPGEATSKDEDAEGSFPNTKMEVVGYKLSGDSKLRLLDEDASGTIEVGGQTLTRYRYDTVVTRVPKDPYADPKDWTVQNHLEVTVTPAGKVDAASMAGSNRSFTYQKPEFYDPDGMFNTWKRADGAYRANNRDIYKNTSGSGVFSTMTIRAGEYSRYDLNDFSEEGSEMEAYDGFDYAVWVFGMPGVFTKADKAEPSGDGGADGQGTSGEAETVDETSETERYWKVPVRYVLEDTEVSIVLDDKTETILGAGDYRIDSIQFGLMAYDGVYDEDSKSFKQKKADVSQDKVTFYGKTAADGEWIRLGTASLDPANISGEGENGAFFAGNTLILEEGTDIIAYRAETENRHYLTSLGTVPNYSLLGSEHVLGIIQGQNQISLHNKSAGSLYLADREKSDAEKDEWSYFEEAKFTIEKDDYDYARISKRDSDLNKDVVATSNKTKTRQYVISWRINMKETIQSGADDSVSNKLQEGGTFYDLLPAGAVLDRASVAVRGSDSFLESNGFTVEQKANYKGSGRTMMIVRVKEPGTNYSLYYDTLHSWESIKDLGTDVANPVAYQTGNPDIANGAADDPANISGLKMSRENKTLMAGLDGSSTGKRFIYDEESHNIVAYIAASAGLNKRVMAIGDSGYSSETFVQPKGDYIYRLRIAANVGAMIKDIVFFDRLEDGVKSGQFGEWEGILSAVDVSDVETLGIRPVIYWTEDPEAVDDMSGEDTIGTIRQNLGSWHVLEAGADLTEAKAVAVDLGSRKDGSDFVLEELQSLSVYLYMKAPESVECEKPRDVYPETYNDVSLYYADVTGEGNTVPSLVSQGSTTVKYIVKSDVKLHKQQKGDATVSIPDIDFRLRGTSDYGTEIDLISRTDRNGDLVFEGVEKSTQENGGGYILSEYRSTDDWLLNPEEHKVYIDNRGNVTIDNVLYQDSESNIFTVENEPRIHGDLVFYKYSLGTEQMASVPVGGITFALTGTSDYGTEYGNTVQLFAVSDDQGCVKIPNIEKGSSYTLRETNIPEDVPYLTLPVQLKVVVDEFGVASIVTTEETGEWVEKKNNDTYVYNEPRYWEFSIRKRDADDPAKGLEDAEFTLTGTSDLGTETEITAVSDSSGLVRFEQVEKGSYLLKETKAPSGLDADGKKAEEGAETTFNYIADTKEHIVTIDEKGKVEIQGLEKEQETDADGNVLSEIYCVDNKAAKDKQIVIVKKWNDQKTNEERPEPVIHLATSKSLSERGYTVTYKANGGRFERDGKAYTSNVVRYSSDGSGTEAEGSYLTPEAPSAQITGTASELKFVGWYTDPDCTEGHEFDADAETKALTGNVVVYAKWELKFFIETTEYGGVTYAKIFWHNSANKKMYTASTAPHYFNEKDMDRFSLLDMMDQIKADGKYQFAIYYPESGRGYSNIWRQDENPTTISRTSDAQHQNKSYAGAPVNGYEAVDITPADGDTYWGGLERSDNTTSYLDGSTHYTYYFYTIGSYQSWGSWPGTSGATIPGIKRSDTLAVHYVELWIACDPAKVQALNGGEVKLVTRNFTTSDTSITSWETWK